MKKFSLFLFLCLSIPLLWLIHWNYVHDTLGVLNPDFLSRRLTVAQQFVKMRYIVGNPEKYNSFIFGSSRVAAIDPTHISGDGKWYNMTYQEALPMENLRNLRQMINAGVKIKELWIGLDDASFREDDKDHKEKLGDKYPYRPYDVNFYLELLLRKPEPLQSPEFIYEKGLLFDIYHTGMTPTPWTDQKIDANPDAHRNDPRFMISYARHGNRMKDTLEEIKEIKELAEENDICITFFINPIYVGSYLDNDLEEFDEFKRQLAKITPYYDFSGITPYATDTIYFYEGLHYRPILGDKMIEVMTHKEAFPFEFGRYVTENNIAEHINRQHEQQRLWEERHPEYRETFSYYQRFGDYLPPEMRDVIVAGKKMYVHLDQINGKAGLEKYTLKMGTPLVLSAWILTPDGAPAETAVVLTRQDGTNLYMHAENVNREDVARMFTERNVGDFGVAIRWKEQNLPNGTYQIRFLSRTARQELFISNIVANLEVTY